MSFKTFGRAFALAFPLLAPFPLIGVADDEIAKPAPGTPIPYEKVEADNPEIRKIWANLWDDYLSQEDNLRVIWLAHLKDNKGRDITISQVSTPRVCGATNCPVKVYIGEEMIGGALYCDAQDYHVLVPSKSAVFFCDIAVPLETAADKVAAGRK